MKKILLTAGAVALLLFASCNKERQCKCSYNDGNDDNSLRFMYVDHGMKCENITEMSEEVHITDSTTTPPTHSLRRIEVHKVTCREYGK